MFRCAGILPAASVAGGTLSTWGSVSTGAAVAERSPEDTAEPGGFLDLDCFMGHAGPQTVSVRCRVSPESRPAQPAVHPVRGVTVLTALGPGRCRLRGVGLGIRSTRGPSSGWWRGMLASWPRLVFFSSLTSLLRCDLRITQLT